MNAIVMDKPAKAAMNGVDVPTLLATIGALAVRLLPAGLASVETFLSYFIYLNVILAVFNMLPISPLDGWKVLLGLVPPATEFKLRRYEPYGMMILLILILADNFLPGMQRSLLWTILNPPVQGVLQLLTRVAGA